MKKNRQFVINPETVDSTMSDTYLTTSDVYFYGTNFLVGVVNMFIDPMITSLWTSFFGIFIVFSVAFLQEFAVGGVRL